MNFDLNQASEGQKQTTYTGPKYQRPGIVDGVAVTAVSLNKTSVNNVDYLLLETISPDGAVGKSNKMFLSTDVKPGKKTSGWGVTARNIINMLTVTHNIDEDAAKALFGTPASKEDIVKILTPLLVGKPFRAKFKGEEGRTGAIYAELAGVESMNIPTTETRLKFNPEKDIQKYEGIKQTDTEPASPVNDKDDLPF